MNRNVVVREIDRADAAVIRGLGVAGTATVHEAIGRVGFAGADLRPIQQDVRVAGSAVTVLSHPGDNLMLAALHGDRGYVVYLPSATANDDAEDQSIFDGIRQSFRFTG